MPIQTPIRIDNSETNPLKRNRPPPRVIRENENLIRPDALKLRQQLGLQPRQRRQRVVDRLRVRLCLGLALNLPVAALALQHQRLASMRHAQRLDLGRVQRHRPDGPVAELVIDAVAHVEVQQEDRGSAPGAQATASMFKRT